MYWSHPRLALQAYASQFTTKYPGKVHSVLPADIYAKSKASKTKKGTVSGQVTAKSYDQAASECKHAVEKIARECRRVNHKYRDPHFDIEWDLKRDRRDCLDGLEIDDEDRSWPKSVKRIPVSTLELLISPRGAIATAKSVAGYFQ